MSNKKLTKADLKRMEDLSKKIAADKKETAKEKQKINKLKKDVDAEKKKLASQWKELKNKQKQSQIDKQFKSDVASKNAVKASKSGGGGNIKKLKAELLEMKTKMNMEGKRARNFKQQVDQLTAENKVLQRKLKNLQGRKEKGEDPRIRNLLRENKQLKKQIKLLMIELNKKRRWFQRCIKSFKSSRSRWIKKQEDALKKKGFLIRYVFLDDVKQIKAYKEKAAGKKGGKGKTKYKNKVKVKSRDGGVIVLHDVEIVVLDNEDDDDNDGGKKGKGKKKGKKSKGDKLDEMEAFLDELQKEIEADQSALGGDDYKDMDSDDDFDINEDIGDLDGDYTMDQLAVDAAADNVDGDNDNDNDNGANKTPKTGNKTPQSGNKTPKSGGKTPKSGNKTPKSAGKSDYLGLPVQSSIDSGDNAALGAQLVYLKKEMDDRTDDIEKIKEILSDGEKYPDPVGDVKNYILNIGKRGEELVGKLTDELHAEQDDVDQMQGNNDRWVLWLNNLALGMAENGELFNSLIGIYDYYSKELQGRIDDLGIINNINYVNKKEENTYDGLKESVNTRHTEVEGEFKNILNETKEEETDDNYDENKEKEKLEGNKQKVIDIRDNLINNNSNWKELIGTVESDYNEANNEKGKLVNGLNDTKNELKELMDLIEKIPKRKIFEEKSDNENKQEEEEVEDNNDEYNDNDNDNEVDGTGDD